MSDVGSDAEDFETSASARRRKPPSDDAAESEAPLKKVRREDGPTEDGAAAAGAAHDEDDPDLGEARYGEVPAPSFERPAHVLAAPASDGKSSLNMYVKTLNVKDICSIITGCCSLPGVEAIMITFTPAGMEFYTKPSRVSPLVVQAFYGKSNFTTYQVSSDISHVVPKGELDDMKKRIAKEVEFLEIKDGTDGFVAGGRRTYKKGGSCDFHINLSSMEDNTIAVVDMSTLKFNLQVRTASQHFADNVAFFDDQVKYIQLAVKPKLLEFKGLRDTGSISKSIDQIINDGFSGEFKAIFTKKNLKAVTSARDINQALCISFNLTEMDFPIHFMYEMGHDKSHFSVYIAALTADERD